MYTYNELAMAVPPEHVWAWLVRATAWPSYYGNASSVRFADGSGPDLRLGTRFTWKTFGVTVETMVAELEPLRRLAWSGRTLGGTGYHGWVIEPAGAGCRVVTESDAQDPGRGRVECTSDPAGGDARREPCDARS